MDSQIRKNAIQQALKDFGQTDGLYHEVNFREQTIRVPVVTLNPQLLLLNHANFRIHSQVQDSAIADLITSDPQSPEAQKAIENLLAATKEFGALKEQLAEYGQKEPGLISADGLLVNGNTRAVALRQLSSTGMRVAVLPPSADNTDLLIIQSDLQMQRWIHQDYSFTNELLFLEELRDSLHFPIAKIVSSLGWKKGRASEKKLEKKFRLLKMIREVRRLSPKPIPYEFFDDKSQILMDLDTDYETLKDRDFERAEKLKFKKLTAMIRGLTKDQVRIIDEGWLDVPGESEVSGGIFGGSATSEREEFIKAAGANFDDHGKPTLPEDQDEKEDAIRQRARAENAINKKRLKNIVQRPQELIEDATIKMNDLLHELSGALVSDDFDKEKFMSKVPELESAFATLKSKIDSLR